MWLNNTFSRRKRYRVYLRLYLPRPLHLTSPRPRPTRPRVPYVPRPIPDVPTSLPSRPQVPSPHTRVPMSPSPGPRPTFIHSRFIIHIVTNARIRKCNLHCCFIALAIYATNISNGRLTPYLRSAKQTISNKWLETRQQKARADPKV